MTNEKSKETLTALQKRFCKEYPIDFNGTEAYLRASHGGATTKKSAGVQASKLLKVPKVKEFIEAYVQEQLGPLEKDLLGNVRFWIMVRDDTFPGTGLGKLISLDKVKELLTDKEAEKLAKLPTYEVSIGRTADRLKASEQLAKYRSMFVEKKEISTEARVTIVDNIE